MELLVHTLRQEIDKLMENQVKLVTIGDIQQLPVNCQENIRWAVDKTKDNTGVVLILALSYSGRWEMTQAVRAIARDVKTGKVNPEYITEETIERYLATAGIPDPELLIRTSGEMRVSNFLLWQIAYTEIYITPTLWPDFRKENLYEAIWAYQQRERRFGKTSEQLNPVN
jgi:undecaprenyl diphosphate synthase